MRGLAALSVLVFHLRFVPNPALPAIPGWLFHEAAFGSTGVLLFFVISGFSLSMTMKNHLRNPHPNVSYGLSRFFRIAPLFYLMILISLVRDQSSFHHHARFNAVLLNASFLFNLRPHTQEGIAWASWTIGVEMLFYALFPFLYRLTLPVVLAITALGYVCLVATLNPIDSNTYATWSFIGYLPLFAIGMLAYAGFQRLRHDPARHGPWLFLSGVATLLACSWFRRMDNEVFLRIPVGLGYALLLVGCGLLQPKLIVNRITVFLGLISYSIYLIHAPIIYALGPLYWRLFRGEPGGVAYIGATAVSVAVILPLAFLLNRYVESPCDRFRKRLVDRLAGLNLAHDGRFSFPSRPLRAEHRTP